MSVNELAYDDQPIIYSYFSTFGRIIPSVLPYTSSDKGIGIMDKGFLALNSKRILTNAKKLDLMSNLKDGWDGYDAPKIASDIITVSHGLLSYLQIQPNIYPTKRGTINMEYDMNENLYLEFEIFNDKIISFMNKNGTISKNNYAFNSFNNAYALSVAINSHISEFFS